MSLLAASVTPTSPPLFSHPQLPSSHPPPAPPQVADALLGVKGSTPDGSDSPAAPAGPANSMRVEGLLARVRGLRFTSGLRFKEDVIDVIDSAYDYVPTEYRTGADTAWEMVNPAGKNEGSCKTFYFAQMHGLDPKARRSSLSPPLSSPLSDACGGRALAPAGCGGGPGRSPDPRAPRYRVAQETVALFAEYALEVEATPQGSSHPNIRRASSSSSCCCRCCAGQAKAPLGALRSPCFCSPAAASED